MKKIVLMLAVAAAMVACKTKDKQSTTGTPMTQEQKDKAMKDSANYTTIEWIDPTTKELGKLIKDQTIEITYRFRNSGTKMLVIEDVQAGCGCTVPEKPQQPFAPGEEGVIRAKFNGSGHGPIMKNITVTSNTTPAKVHNLVFKGEIDETKEIKENK